LGNGGTTTQMTRQLQTTTTTTMQPQQMNPVNALRTDLMQRSANGTLNVQAMAQNRAIMAGPVLAAQQAPLKLTKLQKAKRVFMTKEKIAKEDVKLHFENEHASYEQKYLAGQTQTIDESAFLATADAQKYIWEKEVSDTGGMSNEDIYKKCEQGDFSNFERLDIMCRNKLAKEFMTRDFAGICALGTTAEQVVQNMYRNGFTFQAKNAQGQLQNVRISGVAAMNFPLFRLGISLALRDRSLVSGAPAATADFLKELDDHANQHMMVATLTKTMNAQEQQALRAEYKNQAAFDEAVERDIMSKKFILKTLLLSQLAGLKKIEGDKPKNGEPSLPLQEWDVSYASAFAHCSRVAFTLPSKKDFVDEAAYKEFMDSYMGKNKGMDAGFVSRWGATHRMERATRGANGKRLQELKKFSPFGQRGMNVAVGGLGNSGISGGLLKNDGSCGHLYMKLDEGDDSSYTGMLLGFESDRPGHKNQMGHRHGAGIKNENQSSFGGQRTDEIGNKYGGRVVDASHFGYNPLEFARAFQAVDALVERAKTGSAADQQALEQLAVSLSGKQLDKAGLEAMLQQFGVNASRQFKAGIGH